jgi:hypothetical protein
MSDLVPAQEPVLVVHGIGNRDQKGFNERVTQLASDIGSQYALIPVHWGGLAASTLHLDKIMPAKPASEKLPAVRVEAQEPGFWDELIEKVGEAIETGVSAADGGLRRVLRAGVSENIVPYLGDIIVYQGMRDQFHRTVRSYIPGGYGTIDRPIKAIGHSLGGVMLFDLAVSTSAPPVWLSHLVTLGSQPSFFHLQHRRSDSVREYAGEPVTLPPMIRAWTNVLDDDDWLSFAVEPVFRLSGGGSPRDMWVDNTEGAYSDVFTLAAHNLYWGNPAVHAIIREAFAG